MRACWALKQCMFLLQQVQHYGDSWNGISDNSIAAPKPYFDELRTMIDTVASHPSVIQ